jgi:hypothetical protein
MRLQEAVMHFTRPATWTLALLLVAGCSNSKPATLVQGDKEQIQVTILAKTGDNLAAQFEQALPSGTPVSILDETQSKSTVKILIEAGEFKGKEAIAPRKAIRLAE